MRPIFALFPLLFLFCQDSVHTPPVSEGEITRSRTAITAKGNYGPGEVITVSFSNEKDSAIYIQTCCGPLSYCIDRLDSGEWTEYRCSDMPCLKMCMGVAILVTKINPRQEIIDAEIEQKGAYRFRFLYTEDAGPTQELQSNTFVIE